MAHLPLAGTSVLTVNSADHALEEAILFFLLVLVCVASLIACAVCIKRKGLFSQGPQINTQMPGVAKKMSRQQVRKAKKKGKAQQALQGLGHTSSLVSTVSLWSKVMPAVCAVPSHWRVLEATQLFWIRCVAGFQYAAFIAIQHPCQLLIWLLVTAFLHIVLGLVTLPVSRFDIRNKPHSKDSMCGGFHVKEESAEGAECSNNEPLNAPPSPSSPATSKSSPFDTDPAAPTSFPAAVAPGLTQPAPAASTASAYAAAESSAAASTAAAYTAVYPSFVASAVGHARIHICTTWALLWDICTSPHALPSFCKAMCSLIRPSPAPFVAAAAVQQDIHTPTAVQRAPWWHSACSAVFAFFWPSCPAHCAPAAAAQPPAPTPQSHFGHCVNSCGHCLRPSWQHRISGAWQVLLGFESVTAVKQENMHLRGELQQLTALKQENMHLRGELQQLTALKQENMHLRDQLQQVAASAAADKEAAVELLEDKDNDLQHFNDLVTAQTENLTNNSAMLRKAGTAANTLETQVADQAKLLGKKDGCLRTAEAFIAALEDRLQESAAHELALNKIVLADQHAILDLQTDLFPLQRASKFAHHLHNLQDLVMLPRFGLSSLAAGTFGAPQSGYHPSMGSFVIKLPTVNSTATDFNQEAKHLAMCRHPNVVQYFGRVWDDTWAPDRIPGILIEKLSMDLHTYLSGLRQGSLGFKKVLNIGLQLAAGLNSIHQRGYLHGDLKPNNVGISPDKTSVQVKILDFGLVKQPGHYDYGAGLPFVLAYCPPELAVDSSIHISQSAEVFVYGLILAEVAGASRPCPVNNPHYELSLTSLRCDTWVKFPVNHGYPLDFVGLVESCLRMDPALRPSMQEVVLQLGALLP